MKTNEVYLRHILDAIEQIELYAEDIDKATFEEQRMVQDAVIRQLEIIGEASRQLPRSFGSDTTRCPGTRLSACEIELPTSTSTLTLRWSGRLSSTISQVLRLMSRRFWKILRWNDCLPDRQGVYDDADAWRENVLAGARSAGAPPGSFVG